MFSNVTEKRFKDLHVEKTEIKSSDLCKYSLPHHSFFSLALLKALPQLLA